MFFMQSAATTIQESTSSSMSNIEVEQLLKPHKLLDPTLIKGDDDGLACRLKFSNNGIGVALATRLKIENLALAIMNNSSKVPTDSIISYIDLLVLYANHIDQHTNDRVNEKLAVEDKERLVLLFLDAASKLNDQLGHNELNLENARLLSSQVLLFQYLGKAERYSQDPSRQDSANRILKLDKALSIALFLSEHNLPESIHPHNYNGLLSTCRLVKGYCLKDLGHFSEALELQQFDIDFGNNFHKTQALKESCKIITLQLKKESMSSERKLELEEQLISYANLSIDTSLEQNSAVVKRNAENALMHAYDTTGNNEGAKEMAEKMLALESNKDSGIKDYHLKEARIIIEKYENTHTSSMSR